MKGKASYSSSLSDYEKKANEIKASTTASTSKRPVALPLYLQVKGHLIRRVLSGEWRPGELLPSEMKLAEEYGLSQGTVRKAIEEMAVEGLVSRHPGRGTFVTSHRGDYQTTRFRRFYSNKTGKRIAGKDSQYISCEKIKADEQLSKQLQVKTGADIVKFVRIRYLGNHPVLLETIYLNSEICPSAEVIFEQKKPDSIYFALEQMFNILVVKVGERLRARAARPDESELLALASNTPLLEVTRLAYSLGGECVECRVSVCGGDDIHYWNQAE
ncbi:GntR family transcriptional regulator [Halomonas salipaludis]|uniref:HTH gntR-type domain-containing protein n=1 Tax=Halomonas salipaludis TaxID=2032625 RepID=A0A2A2ETB9_9GAMM|nr:GntR family transcriptional regulator [Halomonas salipaludis]PAU75587.1 hypothetical protein CK498_16830 [Halomonas salipaludis]